jgi:hypothetical protein
MSMMLLFKFDAMFNCNVGIVEKLFEIRFVISIMI